jgi:predicted hotdog family 3-hydroxylacyl-ACP dehydratase
VNRIAIEALIPHKGTMSLLDGVIRWDDESIVAFADPRARAEHPLRFNGRVPALVGIEYAAQAMALHSGLRGHSGAGSTGMLASIRDLSLNAEHLDEGSGQLEIEARAVAIDPETRIYRVRVVSQGRVLLEGRLSVVTHSAGALDGV